MPLCLSLSLSSNPPNENLSSRDHDATLASVRAAQAETDGHAADSAALAAFAHSARVARCAAEAELARRKKAAEASAATWRRRLEARQREVRVREVVELREVGEKKSISSPRERDVEKEKETLIFKREREKTQRK